MKKKIFVLIPDGVSLRNFAYTSFFQQGIDLGFDVIYWNQTPFDLDQLGIPQKMVPKLAVHPITDLYKTARIKCELQLYAKRDNDTIYHNYSFPLAANSFKKRVKKWWIHYLVKRNASEAGIEKLRKNMIAQERKTALYKACRQQLEEERPAMVFCASQRAITAVAPLTAAQDLKIPTASFIFSWDNVPKATTVVSTDFYFVWSEHMKNELLHYQRYIRPSQVYSTGTPQFEPHFNDKRILTREQFCQRYKLDPNNRYICFSGDDNTTSPKDELYLRDVARAIRNLNNKGAKLKLIFRRCPVDFSNRYDRVLIEYADEITEIPPLWKQVGEGWNTVLPLPEDLDLQATIIAHCELVINLASSMVFDFAAFGKPCAYMNYNYLNNEETVEPGVYLYDFVHFRSMPSENAVVWLSHPDSIGDALMRMLAGVPNTVEAAQNWFKKINLHPPQHASKRIWKSIESIVSNNS